MPHKSENPTGNSNARLLIRNHFKIKFFMMRLKLYLLFFVLLFLGKTQFAQQLVINEVSQGPTGAKEYVELLVVGTPTCNAIPCMDLRNFIIDDNNGNHATGAGVGIAAGCVRLQNIPFWQCIPYGTIIVFYKLLVFFGLMLFYSISVFSIGTLKFKKIVFGYLFFFEKLFL